MIRILPVLLSLVVLIEITEGGAVLCQSSKRKHRGHSSSVMQRSFQSDDYSDLESDDDYVQDGYPRKESLRDKTLRAMLMEDSEDPNNRAENAQNDYSALEASLRSDIPSGETRRSENEWTIRRMRSNEHGRYDSNQYGKFDDDYN